MFTIPDIQESHLLAGQRRKLVEELRQKGISSPEVLRAMGVVPRQLFFPRDFEKFIYRDAAFPIGHDQTISQPYTVAYQTQLLQLSTGDKVLEIGTGSGYQAAVLSAMGVRVFSVEVLAPLLKEASGVLKKLDNEIQLFHGDGSLGLPAHAPFDAILVTAGAPEVPKSLINQLKPGGRLVIPVGEKPDNQRMMRITRLAGNQTRTEVFGQFRFVPLRGKEGWDAEK
ncbi:MAG: protein-L-isoaspartate(D-aspartate) O-methyltransferase [Bacteroidetes bacterium]|nr:protein-L-isoaspartate(D-aspartate) O-methyltransferase [Bacteroidota bacterium]